MQLFSRTKLKIQHGRPMSTKMVHDPLSTGQSTFWRHFEVFVAKIIAVDCQLIQVKIQ